MDPSPDRTEAVVLEHRAGDERIKLLKFSRRVGQPMATLAGLEYSRGDAVIVMDVDLQDPPELITTMVEQWRAGYDIVLPQRRQRTGEPWLKKVVSAVGYKVINKIADVTIPAQHRRLPPDVAPRGQRAGQAQGVPRLPARHGGVVGFKQCPHPVRPPGPLHAGETNYNRFFGSLRIGFNGIFCFSTYALQLSTILGFIIAGGSFLLTAIYLFYKLMGWTILWGNPTLVILMSFLGGIQLISVGILGEYIGRIYEEVRGRPKFIVDQSVGFEPRR